MNPVKQPVRTSKRTERIPLAIRQPANALPEVSVCLALGFRDGIRPKLALMSVFAGFMAFGIWLVVFLVWRTEIWTLADIAAKWVMNGLLSLVWSDGLGGGADVTSGSAGAIPFWERAVGTLTTPLWSVVKFLLFVGSFVLLIMLTMRLYLEFFLMSRIQRQCLKHYPSLTKGMKGSFRADLGSTLVQLAVLCGSVLFLLIPVIGGIFFFLLASYLNVRGLVNDALEDLATLEERRAVVESIRVPMLLLGVAVAGLLLIPLAGLFIPALLGASVCHLCMRALIRLRSSGPAV